MPLHYTCTLYNNGTSVTNYLFQFQSIWSILLGTHGLSHPSLAWFYSLLEEFFWDARQLHRYDPLDGLSAITTILFRLGVVESHTEQDKANSGVLSARQCFSRPETGGSSAHLVQLLFKHVQIFGDNHPRSVLFFFVLSYYPCCCFFFVWLFVCLFFLLLFFFFILSLLFFLLFSSPCFLLTFLLPLSLSSFIYLINSYQRRGVYYEF